MGEVEAMVGRMDRVALMLGGALLGNSLLSPGGKNRTDARMFRRIVDRV